MGLIPLGLGMIQTETVIRLRAGTTTDPYSNESVPDWDAASSLTITTLAPAEPRPSQEPVQDARNAVTSGWTLYLPSGTDITERDRVVVRGITHSVLGKPADWLGAGIVVQCDVTEG